MAPREPARALCAGQHKGDRRLMHKRQTAFYCVSDARHFIGVVALLNSLRLVGHREPLFVVDCGLAPWQRTTLRDHATVVRDRTGLPPMLLKAAAPLEHPAAVMVVLDADVLVTRNLDPLVGAAARGQIVAFQNDNTDRFFSTWGELLGLGMPRRQPYVASGHLFVPGDAVGRSFLERFHESQQSIDLRRTLLANGELVIRSTPDEPFYYPDMDVLNAVLATSVDTDKQLAVDYRLAPHAPFRGLQVHRAKTLDCRYEDGTSPFLLHHVLRKPWLEATKSNVYSRLLPRVLLGPDVELRLDPSRVPIRLRIGHLAALERTRADVQAIVHEHARGRLGVRPRLASWRAAHAERGTLAAFSPSRNGANDRRS